MLKNRKGMMIVLSSPSGAGKTTLVKLLKKKNKDLQISISYTTRKPRKLEKEGKDYHFINKNKFNNLIKKKALIEHAKVFNNLYGTGKKKVIKNLSQNKDVLFDIDWQGTEKIKKKKLNYKVITIFILPPTIKALKTRLSNRDMKDKLIVEERMSQFKNDILHWKEYDYVVINNSLSKCYSEIIKIIKSERKNKKITQNIKKIKEKVKKLIS